MKLGEALTLRAKQRGKLSLLQHRINATVVVQEGDEEQVDSVASQLIDEWLQLSSDHGRLIMQINETNALEGIDVLLQQREQAKRDAGFLRGIARYAEAAMQRDRYSRTEIKNVALVDAEEIYRRAEERDEEATRLDLEIQKRNWSTDLKALRAA